MDPHFSDQYGDAIYQQANVLTDAQFELSARHFAQVYRGYLPENVDATVLDIGCGAGHFLYFLEQGGYRAVVGIDVSPQQVEKSRMRVKGRVEVADAFEFLDGKEGVYDLITAHDMLEHVLKDKALVLVQKMFRALKPGGLLILRVPNMSNPFAMHSRYIDMTHEIGFTDRSLYQLLYMAGFRDVSFQGSLRVMRRTWRSYARRIFLKVYYAWVRFLYYVQDFSVPKVLDHDLLAFCRKPEDAR